MGSVAHNPGSISPKAHPITNDERKILQLLFPVHVGQMGSNPDKGEGRITLIVIFMIICIAKASCPSLTGWMPGAWLFFLRAEILTFLCFGRSSSTIFNSTGTLVMGTGPEIPGRKSMDRRRARAMLVDFSDSPQLSTIPTNFPLIVANSVLFLCIRA